MLLLTLLISFYSCNKVENIKIGSHWIYEIKDFYLAGDSFSYLDTIRLVDSFLFKNNKYFVTNNQNYLRQTKFLNFYNKHNGLVEPYYIFPFKDTLYSRRLYLYGNDTDTLSYDLIIKYDSESKDMRVKAGKFCCNLFTSEETMSNEKENNFYQKRLDYVDPKFGLIKTESFDGVGLTFSRELIKFEY